MLPGWRGGKIDHFLLEFYGELADPVQVFQWRFWNDILGVSGSWVQHTFGYQIDQFGDTPASVVQKKKDGREWSGSPSITNQGGGESHTDVHYPGSRSPGIPGEVYE